VRSAIALRTYYPQLVERLGDAAFEEFVKLLKKELASDIEDVAKKAESAYIEARRARR